MRLRTEVRAHIPSPDQEEISACQLESLPLLRAICEETLRLHPTVPETIRVAARDSTIQGVYIPKGAHIILSYQAINRDASIWGLDSNDFIPDRWLRGDARYSHVSFSSGSQNCIGRDIARSAMLCTIACLFGRFAMELRYPDRQFKESGVIGMHATQGCEVILRPIEGW